MRTWNIEDASAFLQEVRDYFRSFRDPGKYLFWWQQETYVCYCVGACSLWENYTLRACVSWKQFVPWIRELLSAWWVHGVMSNLIPFLNKSSRHTALTEVRILSKCDRCSKLLHLVRRIFYNNIWKTLHCELKRICFCCPRNPNVITVEIKITQEIRN